MRGRVKFFSRSKGYGFILEEESGLERYFNDHNVSGDLPRKGELVEFEPAESEGHPQADNVRVVAEKMPTLIECKACGQLCVPRIYRRHEALMSPATEHICPLCGVTLYETGGGFQPGVRWGFWIVLWSFALMMVDHFCLNRIFNPDFFSRENFFVVPMFKFIPGELLAFALPMVLLPPLLILGLRSAVLESAARALTHSLAFLVALAFVLYLQTGGKIANAADVNTNFLWAAFNAFFLWIVVDPFFRAGDFIADRLRQRRIGVSQRAAPAAVSPSQEAGKTESAEKR